MTVLALRALGLGDLLTGLPALRGLRAALPDRRIVLGAPRWLEPVARLSGALDAVVDTAPLAVPAVRAPELAVNLHGRGPESTAALRATRPRRLWAFGLPDGPAYQVAGPVDGAWHVEHETRRWCRLLAWYGVPCDPGDLRLPRPVPSASAPDTPFAPCGNPATRRGLVIVYPGGAAPARRWPPERWAAVARELSTAGWPVAITGGRQEVDVARHVARLAGLPETSVLAGRTDLLGLCALVCDAALLLAADTGVGHLATAYGTPSVLLFGPVAPAEWGPPASRPIHRSLWSGRPGDPRATSPDPGLLALTVDEVTRAAVDLLEVSPPVVPADGKGAQVRRGTGQRPCAGRASA